MHRSERENLVLQTANRLLQNDVRDSVEMERDGMKAESCLLERDGLGKTIWETKK